MTKRLTMLNIPSEWKTPQWRWHCNHCKAEGWESKDRQGIIPQHDRPDSRACRLAQITQWQPMPDA